MKPESIQPELSHSPRIYGKDQHAVVLVHYGPPETTQRCVRSLACQELFPHTVIVVDHGPQPDLQAALEGLHPDLTIIPAHHNPGFGAGCNRGAEWAFQGAAEGVWFLNNDAVLEGPLLEFFVSLASDHPEVAFWAHTQQDHDRRLGADQQPTWYQTTSASATTRVAPEGCRFIGPQESLSGASLFITRQQWEEIGPWPEDFFLYYEDAAWCHRAHTLGRPMAILERTILHDPGTTTGRRSPLTVFYGVRNRLRLHQDLHPTARYARAMMGLNLLQKRLFQGRWRLLKPTWDGIWAAVQNRHGRDPRY